MMHSDDSRLHVQSDAAKQTKFTTLRVRGNGETVYRKVYLRTNDPAVAHRRVDCLSALGVKEPSDARQIIAYLAASPSPEIERKRVAELTNRSLRVPTFSLEDARRELTNLIDELGELPTPTDKDVADWRDAFNFDSQLEILVRLGVPKDWLSQNPSIFDAFERRRMRVNAKLPWKKKLEGWGGPFARAADLPVDRPARGPKLSDCVEQFRIGQEQKGNKPGSIRPYINRFQDFVDFLKSRSAGREPSVQSLKKADFVAFRDHKIGTSAKPGVLWDKSPKTKKDHFRPIIAVLTTARTRMDDGTFPDGLDNWFAVFDLRRFKYRRRPSNAEPVPPEVFRAWLRKADDDAEIDWQDYGDSLPVDTDAQPKVQALQRFNNRKQAKRVKRNGLLAHVGLCLGANVGVLPIDLARLRWADLRLSGPLPLFTQHAREKTADGHDIEIPVRCPLLPATIRTLKRWKKWQDAERPSEHVFTSEHLMPFDQDNSSAVVHIFRRIRKAVPESGKWEFRHLRNIGETLRFNHGLHPDMGPAWLRHSAEGTNVFYRGKATDDYLSPLIKLIGQTYFTPGK